MLTLEELNELLPVGRHSDRLNDYIPRHPNGSGGCCFGRVGGSEVENAWMIGSRLVIDLGILWSISPEAVLVVVNGGTAAKTRQDILCCIAEFVRSAVGFTEQIVASRKEPYPYARWFLGEGLQCKHTMCAYELEVAKLACEMLLLKCNVYEEDELVVLEYHD